MRRAGEAKKDRPARLGDVELPATARIWKIKYGGSDLLPRNICLGAILKRGAHPLG